MHFVSRRRVCGGLTGLSIIALAGGKAASNASSRLAPFEAFSWEELVRRAQALARAPYKATPPAPEASAIDFDAAGKLTYGPAQTLAGKIRLIPVSRTAPEPVRLNLVEEGRSRRLLSTAGLFVGGRAVDPAGFRVLTARGNSDWLAFQGASYFRAAGSRDQYGLSARGVAVDTALPSGEQFPRFTEFWIEAVSDQQVRIYALLDGPSITGAMQFNSRSDAQGVTQDVIATLAFRKNIERLGIAPASSMFWFDQSSPDRTKDWRPEIHDSDGLAIWSGDGERIWRPLHNPRAPRVNSFTAANPRGFGLMQRDQRFADYQDDGAFYDRRPSLWVEPLGHWGSGVIMLYELPTNTETNDNVAAFWVSDVPARQGEHREWRYRLRWTSDDPSAGKGARLVDSWTGSAGIPGAPPIKGARKLVFDFEGDSLAGLDRNSRVEAVTTLPKPAVLAIAAYPVAGHARRWRVTIDVVAGQISQSEFRLFLKRDDAAISETVIDTLAL